MVVCWRYEEKVMFGMFRKNIQVEMKSNSDIKDAVWRDRFAGQALRLFTMMDEDIQKLQAGAAPQHKKVAKFCYDLADAMLAERRKREGGDG